MSIQHASIADANRHENKHASSASNGQVLKAKGDGTTEFVNPSTLQNITIGSSIEGTSNTSQGPSSTDTVHQVTWGSGSSSTDVTIGSNGLITINTAGLYLFSYTLSLGRSSNSGVATLVTRLLLNNAEFGHPQAVRIDASTDVKPITVTLFRKFSPGDELKVQLIRDSAGTNDGGLITIDPTPSGWSNSPAATVRLSKIVGGY